jgi:hypothetical protein
MTGYLTSFSQLQRLIALHEDDCEWRIKEDVRGSGLGPF